MFLLFNLTSSEVKDLVDETVLGIGSNTMAQENPYRFIERSVDAAEGNEHCSRTIGVVPAPRAQKGGRKTNKNN